MKFWGLLAVASIISSFGDSHQPTIDIPIVKASFLSPLETYKKPIPRVRISFPTPPKWFSQKLLNYITTEANNSSFKIKVPVLLIYKLIEWESGWKQSAFHHNMNRDGITFWSTDWGLMQICDAYMKELIHDYHDPWRKESSYDVIHNPYDNLQIGIRKLRHMYEVFGTWTKAVAAYNAGRTTVAMGVAYKAPTRQELHHVIPIENWWTFPARVEIVYNKYIY